MTVWGNTKTHITDTVNSMLWYHDLFSIVQKSDSCSHSGIQSGEADLDFCIVLFHPSNITLLSVTRLATTLNNDSN